MKTNHLNTPIKPGEITTLNDAVLDGIISLGEVMGDIKDRINNAQITMLQVSSEEYKYAIKTVSRINIPANEKEQEKFKTQDGFLTRTARLRLDFEGEPKILYSNGKGYLVIDKESVYEVIEQKGNDVIAYNPIDKKNVLYFKKNNNLIVLNKLSKTPSLQNIYYYESLDGKSGYFIITEFGIETIPTPVKNIS